MSNERAAATAYRQTACPDASILARFLVGLSDEPTSKSLEQHLLHCDRCCETARSLPSDDTLGSMLDSNTFSEVPADDVEVQAVIDQWRSLSDARRAGIEETQCVAAESTRDDKDVLAGIMDPPLADGELGRLGPYRILRVLGSGGMGIVFEAEEAKLKRRVALKVLNPSLAAQPVQRRRFLREAQAAAAIEHPHIVTIFQVGESGEVPYLAMQLLKGEGLDDRLRREKKLSVAEALRIGRETAEALAEAHARGMIHRDIKPSNIWLEAPQGFVKLVDFGLAQVTDDVQLTQFGTILGTPAYMSPEQARGDAVDHRSDLFSLGSVLYKLLTGRSAFEGPSTLAVLTALAVKAVTPPSELEPGLPSAVSALVMRLLAKQPAGRFDSARATAAAIRDLESELSASAVASNSLDTIARAEPRAAGSESGHVGRGRRLILVMVAAAFVLMAGIVIVIRNKDGSVANKIAVPDDQSVSIEASNRKSANAAVTPVLPAASANPEPAVAPKQLKSIDRLVAEQVLAMGGYVDWFIGAQTGGASTIAELPTEPFKIYGISLEGASGLPKALAAEIGRLRHLQQLLANNTRLGDHDLKQISNLTSLTNLQIGNTTVTSAGLAALTSLKRLRTLYVQGLQVSDRGAKSIAQLDELQDLWIAENRLTDAGLAELAKLRNLRTLDLTGASVTDAGLQSLSATTELKELWLRDTQIDGSGFVAIAGLPRLRSLSLRGTNVGDEHLAKLGPLPRLYALDLRGTKITDHAVAALSSLKSLTHIDVDGTALSIAAREALGQTLPQSNLNGDTIAANREAAEWVLKNGGELSLIVNGDYVWHPKQLPDGPFDVAEINFATAPAVDDSMLARFAELSNLTHLDIPETPAGNSGLMRLGALKELRQIDASLSKMDDEALASFSGCENLRSLTLRGVQAGRSTIAGFDKLPLEHLEIHFGPVSDDFLACLPYQRLVRLVLLGCKNLSDGGLKHLKAAKRLNHLDLRSTRVTDAVLEYLAQLRELRWLLLGDTRISSTGLTSLSGLAELEVLDLSKTLVGSDLSALAGLDRLCWLSLNDTQVVDERLGHLTGLSDLDHLDLRATAVTAEAVARLQKALPQCLILTDFPQLPVSSAPPTAPTVPPPAKIARGAGAAPMSIGALVGRPTRLKGLKSWTIETRQHRNTINDVAISPDNSLLATAAADGNVRVWDIHSHQLRKVFFGGSRSLDLVNWSPDGKKLAATDAQTYVWDFESGKRERTIPRVVSDLARLAWSPDSNVLALSSGFGSEAGLGVMVWDVASDQLRFRLPNRWGTCAWSPDGGRLAVDSMQGNGGMVVIWDARTGQEKASFQAVEEGLVALAWSPDEKFLAVAGEKSPQVRILDADTGQTVQTLANPSGNPITDLAWSPQGDRFAIVGGELRFWDAATWQPLGSAAPAQRRLKWSDDGQTIATLADQGACLFNVPQRQLTTRFSVLPGRGSVCYQQQFAWSRDAKQVALRSGPTGLGVWDTTTGVAVNNFRTKWQHWFEGLAWSHDGQILAKSSYASPLECFDAVSGKPLKELPFSLCSLEFSPDDRLLAGISTSGQVQICDVSSGQAVAAPFGKQSAVLTWSPKGDQFAMREDFQLFVRRTDNGEALAQFDAQTGQITALAWSPDGEQLAIGDLDGSAVFLWHPMTGVKRVIEVPATIVISLAFSADGQTLMVAQADNTLRTFDVPSLDLLSAVSFATGYGAAFSTDRSRAASLDGGLALHFCNVAQGSTSGVIMPFSENEWIAIGADGHYRGTPGVEKQLIFVAETDDGEQLILSPEEFSQQFGWRNDPARVQLLP